MSGLVDSPIYQALLGGLCGGVGFRFGWRTRNRFLLPLLQGLLGFIAFAGVWGVGGAVAATLAVGGWALGTSIVSIPMFLKEPQRADEQVILGRAYRERMFEWLRTGRGPESRPLATAGAHLRELAIYVVAALSTANALSLVLAAVLLNFMNAYVARLLLVARNTRTVIFLAWNVWSIVRVAAYSMLGSACAAPLAVAALGRAARAEEVHALLVLGAAGVVLDLALKLALSRPCGGLLAAALQPGALEGAGADLV